MNQRSAQSPRSWLMLLLIFFGLRVTGSTLAAELPLHDIAANDAIQSPAVLKWHDPTGSVEFDQLPTEPNVWQLTGATAPAVNHGRTWLRLALTNPSAQARRVIIGFDEAFLEEADLYQPTGTNLPEHLVNGIQVPIEARAIRTRTPAFELLLDAHETREVTVAFRSRFEAVVGLQIQAPTRFAEWVTWQSASYLFFFGGALAIVLFNLFLFASIRDPLYLIYVLHSLCVMGFVARFSGFSLYVIDQPESHYKLAAISWIQAILLVEFTRRLLDTRKLSAFVDRSLQLMMVVLAILTVATLIHVEYYSIGIRLSFPLLVVLLAVGLYSMAKGNPLGRFFVLAQAPYITGYLLLAGASVGILEYTFATRYGFIVGSLLEMVIFSLALGYRFRILQQEKFEAQQQFLELQTSLNDELQRQVDSRTTNLEAATNQLRALTSDYSALLQNIGVGIASLTPDGDTTFTNDAYRKLLNAIPDLQKRVVDNLDSLSRTLTQEITLPGKQDMTHHLLINVCNRVDDNGKLQGLWLVVTDTTELRLQESRMNHAAKMATLGEMSTGMAHELNQPLNAIRLTLNNIRSSLSKDTVDTSKLAERFERIDHQVNRAAKLISHMRTFGRIAPEEFERFDIRAAVDQALDLIGEQLRLDQIELQVSTDDNEPHYTSGSSSQFEQVILNLISNARDAIVRYRGNRRISVQIMRAGDRHQVVVEDTGGGIPKDVIDRIFEPFFTTKAVGEGTGLGAAISYGIIQDMKGDIAVKNQNEGACFTITVPAVTTINL